MSSALESFKLNKKDVEHLWKLHKDIAGDSKGRKYGVEVLNRSAMILITACWESYVEDVISESFLYIVNNISDSEMLPKRIQAKLIEPLKENKDSRELWKLTDKGWVSLLKLRKTKILDSWINGFNTPKSKNVNELFDDILGIKSISNFWRVSKYSGKHIAGKLDEYINVRGNIAHRIKHERNVGKRYTEDYLQLVSNISNITDNIVKNHVNSVVGSDPWL